MVVVVGGGVVVVAAAVVVVVVVVQIMACLAFFARFAHLACFAKFWHTMAIFFPTKNRESNGARKVCDQLVACEKTPAARSVPDLVVRPQVEP